MKFITYEYLEFFGRIILAGVCGFAIGYERKNRGKGAGIRTHMIVGIASALMMVISKYAFTDLAEYPGSRGADPSRIAAQVVSGIGFLGAGMIYFQKQSVKGLTTAAGIWATSGVGMAIGSGLYFIGIASSVLIILLQILLHKNYKIFNMPLDEHIGFVITDTPESIEFFNNTLEVFGLKAIEADFDKLGNGNIEIELTANIPHDLDVMKFVTELQKSEYVKSVKF